MSTVYEILDDSLIIERSKGLIKSTTDNFFSNLRNTITEGMYESREEWENFLKPDEDRWMEDKFGDDPDAKHKSGAKRKDTWKYSLLPKPYQSAKSVLSRALEKGIDVKGKGKTELENMIQGKIPVEGSETTAVVSSNVDKFKKSWLKCRTYHYNMSISEREEANNFMSSNSF